MKVFLEDKIKWYEEHVNQYFLDTIYNTDKLMVELSEDKWFKVNPTRGMKEGIHSYELTESSTEIADFLISSYGEIEYDEMITNKRVFRFSRRKVASGGGLYPNIMYLLIKKNNGIKIFQFDPALGVLRWLKYLKIEDNFLKENTCYFVGTIYYWRNWFKYRYFGYRLMNVDSGYLLANIYAEIIRRGYKGVIYISNKMFIDVVKYIGIDSGKEGICFVVEVESQQLARSVDKLEDICEYKIFRDWDTEDISLYKTIETKALGQSYNFYETINDENKKIIFNSKILTKNRISPGGAAMQNSYPIKKELLISTLSNLTTILADIKNLAKGIDIYIYIKMIEGFKEGLYKYVPFAETKVEFVRNIERNMQSILKKHNFSINDTPAWVIVCYNENFNLSSCSESEFKYIQLKVGFVSHMITVAAAINNCYTHPILGFNVDILEEISRVKYPLNLIAFSERKNLDRQHVVYKEENDNVFKERE